MNQSNHIYTKLGDFGSSLQGDQGTVSKNDPLLIAIADLEEVNALLGVVLANSVGVEEGFRRLVKRLQNQLFDLGADLALPIQPNNPASSVRIVEGNITYLEEQINFYGSKVKPQSSLILPGGTLLASYLHLARTVCRRAERSVWLALDCNTNTTNPLVGKYVNRLSDLLFILGRFANLAHGDVQWSSGSYINEPSDYQILIEL